MVDSVNALTVRVIESYIFEQLGISVGTKLNGMSVIRFPQDNSRSHTAARTVKTISQCGWEQLIYPPYGPDQAFL